MVAFPWQDVIRPILVEAPGSQSPRKEESWKSEVKRTSTD